MPKRSSRKWYLNKPHWPEERTDASQFCLSRLFSRRVTLIQPLKIQFDMQHLLYTNLRFRKTTLLKDDPCSTSGVSPRTTIALLGASANSRHQRTRYETRSKKGTQNCRTECSPEKNHAEGTARQEDFARKALSTRPRDRDRSVAFAFGLASRRSGHVC